MEIELGWIAHHDRSGRLWLDGEVGRTSATANASSAAMEQGDLDAVVVAGGDNVFLRFVELPGGRESASIFARIWVSDHDLITPFGPWNRRGEGQIRDEVMPSPWSWGEFNENEKWYDDGYKHDDGDDWER